jgi:hypothetical protein
MDLDDLRAKFRDLPGIMSAVANEELNVGQPPSAAFLVILFFVVGVLRCRKRASQRESSSFHTKSEGELSKMAIDMFRLDVPTGRRIIDR